MPNQHLKYIEIDLHGDPVVDAVEIADQKIREAWENGSERVTVIHGSPRITHHIQAQHLGRGGIKWALRGRLAQGAWMKYAYNRRSTKHSILDGSMTLALRPNPNPRPEPIWTELPEPYYGGRGRW